MEIASGLALFAILIIAIAVTYVFSASLATAKCLGKPMFWPDLPLGVPLRIDWMSSCGFPCNGILVTIGGAKETFYAALPPLNLRVGLIVKRIGTEREPFLDIMGNASGWNMDACA